MLCCLGFAAKRAFPGWLGLDSFKKYIFHSSFWPEEGVDMDGKKVGVVGRCPTGVQIAQEVAKDADQLTVFIRTSNTAIRMTQQSIDSEQAKMDLESHVPEMLQISRYENLSGFIFPDPTRSAFDDTPKEPEKMLEEAWQLGGFRLVFTYNNILINEGSMRKQIGSSTISGPGMFELRSLPRESEMFLLLLSHLILSR